MESNAECSEGGADESTRLIPSEHDAQSEESKEEGKVDTQITQLFMRGTLHRGPDHRHLSPHAVTAQCADATVAATL